MFNKIAGFFGKLLKNPYVIGLLVLVVAYFVFQLGVTSATSPPACPTTPAQASKLFGGRSNEWTPGSSGWVTVSTSNNRQVSVPGWYSYVDNDGRSFGALLVPARVRLTEDQTIEIVCPVLPPAPPPS